MISRFLRGFVFAAMLAAALLPCNASTPRSCVLPADAQSMLGKDICVAVHVYDVVQTGDGTRYLDVCAPEIPDAQCRFTVVSQWQDHDLVGELGKYRGTDLKIRGTVSSMHGRSGMVLSHERQLHGGPPRLKPNPRLLRGFGGEQEAPAIRDSNLRPQGSARSFMNTRDRMSVGK